MSPARWRRSPLLHSGQFPGAQWIELPKTPNGANRFDQLYKWCGQYIIVEAKAPKSELLWRRGAGPASGRLVQQGTKEYLFTIIAEMKSRALRSPEDGRLAREVEEALEKGNVIYVLVKAVENQGSYAGATLEYFELPEPDHPTESSPSPDTASPTPTYAGSWVASFYLALICRENERLEKLAQVPVSLLRASGAVFDEYIYSWVETLQSFWLGRQDVGDKLVAAVDGTDPEAARYADAELMSKILYPPIILFYRYLRQDYEEFTTALSDALRWHKEYWTATEDRAVSSEGLVALGPLAIACLAHDAGFPMEIESEYLPKALLEYSWAGEIDT